ncbi:MAG TPA: SCO family protein [Casimicrobiaceae bacterium]|nr:SCO family protein [Casimicrobiaceae bacterium]
MKRAALMACALVLATMLASSFTAQAASVLSPAEHVAFSPPRNARLPLDTALFDEDGRAVHLGDYLHVRPVIVVPAYYGCANLCTLVLRGVAVALTASGLTPARDLDVLVISIDPLDTPAAAMQKKRSVLADFSTMAPGGWHFLTGKEPSIAKVTGALGYRYVYDSEERQYAHAGGIAIADVDGRIARVMYGVAFDAPALRRAMLAATHPQDGIAPDPEAATLAQKWLLCFHYDPHTGRYTFAAMSAVRTAALLVLCGLVVYFVRARRQETARRSAP